MWFPLFLKGRIFQDYILNSTEYIMQRPKFHEQEIYQQKSVKHCLEIAKFVQMWDSCLWGNKRNASTATSCK
jgi:hypothetical protein